MTRTAKMPPTRKQESCDSTSDETMVVTDAMAETMFTYRNGRRYHAQRTSSYHMPCDDEEFLRLEILHKALVSVMGSLHSVPNSTFERVLDAGCGPGWWSLDFADANPQCSITGVDLVPIQPKFTPPNLSFECDDICQGLRFRDDTFDMIFSRLTFVAMQDNSAYLKELLRILKPGGYINCIDYVFDVQEAFDSMKTSLDKWQRGTKKLDEHLGLAPEAALSRIDNLSDAGYAELQEFYFRIPGGVSHNSDPYQKELAQHMTESVLLGMSATKHLYGEANGLELQDLDYIFKEVEKDLVNPAVVWDTHWVSVIGRKPSK